MTFYKFITGFVALGTAACAAFFSVLGIATFLGGNFIEVAIMAGFLEAGKLVCASAAYKFRKVAAGWIRGLLVTFTIIMMLITSTGIFGFLSSSYQQAASERDISEQQIENVRSKKESFNQRIERLEQDRQRLVSTQERLQNLQAEQGWLSERQDQRLSEVPPELQTVDSTLSATRDSVLALNQKITELEANQSSEAKLGPIMFVADTVGLDPDRAALYFILLLIFVFDPMAVTLVVALSMATDLEETVTEEDTKEEQSVEEQVEVSATAGKKSMSPLDVAKDLGKPLPDSDKKEEKSMSNEDLREPNEESKESIDQTESGDLNEYEDVNELQDKVLDATEPLSPDERVQRMKDYASVGSSSDLYKKEDSQNKEQGESVEEDGNYQEWLDEAKSEENPDTEEKPWKNPFKPPFGSAE